MEKFWRQGYKRLTLSVNHLVRCLVDRVAQVKGILSAIVISIGEPFPAAIQWTSKASRTRTLAWPYPCTDGEHSGQRVKVIVAMPNSTFFLALIFVS